VKLGIQVAQEGFDFFSFGEGNFVAGDEEIFVHAAEGVFDEGLVFVGAEEKADGWIVSF